MPEQYFGGAPNAFAGGMEFGAATRLRKQKENALAALIERYGPQAADPQAALAMQSAEQQAALHPYDVADAQRVDAARRGEVAKYGTAAGEPAVRKRDVDARTTAAQGVVRVLETARANGGDLGQAFDFSARALQAIGYSPEEMVQMREEIIADPRRIDELKAMLYDPDKGGRKSLSGGVAMRNDATGKIEWVIPEEGGARVIPGYTPVAAEQGDTRLGQGETRLGLTARALTRQEAQDAGFDAEPGTQLRIENGRIIASVVPGSAQSFERGQKDAEAAQEDRNAVRVFSGIITAANTVTRDGQRALEAFDKLGAFTGGPGFIPSVTRMAASKVWATDVRRLRTNIQSVMDNIGIDKLLEIKASGAGLGHVPQSQLITLQSLLGRLIDLDRDPKELKVDLVDALARYDEIIEQSREEVKQAEQRIQQRKERQGREQYVPAAQPAGVPDTGGMTDEELMRILTGGGN